MPGPGTAELAGDRTLDLTGWGPGLAVLLPAGLIVMIMVAWKLGAEAVLSFWLAYILTRPLGANLGDFLGSSRGDGGLGLGTFGTSILFLSAILVVVAYLTRTRKDQAEPASAHQRHSATYHGPSHDAYPRPSIGDQGLPG